MATRKQEVKPGLKVHVDKILVEELLELRGHEAA